MAAVEPATNGFPNPEDEIHNNDDFDEEEILGGADDDSETTKPSSELHPLEHSWTFLFDNPAEKQKKKQASWGNTIRSIHTFATVEQFWSLYNNIDHPSKLAVGADFYCFKEKIKPKWEDPICVNGGKWTVSFSRGKSDTSWLYTLLAMIGEQFDHGDEICGAVVNVRGKQEKISVWTKNAANESAQLSIGKQWKIFLEYNETIGFMFHEDAKKLNRHAWNKYNI